ncbi:MAG: type II toxin-antitoxin system VapB family antitoxin [Gemmatimonadota bacterium]
MAFSIKNEEADRLARELAEATGETLTDAVLTALRERLRRVTGSRRSVGLREEIARMQERVARLPVLDGRSDDEILGYDEHGIPD